MKFKASKKQVVPILKEVSKAIDPKSSINILKNILFVADIEKDMVSISGCNNLISIQSLFQAKVEEGGSVAVLGDMIISTLELSSGDEFVFHVKKDSKRIDLLLEKGKYKMSFEDAEQFPIITKPNEEAAVKIVTSSEKLKQLIRRTTFVCDANDSRIFMSSINIETQKENIVFTAVNGTVMARTYSTEKNMNYDNKNVLVYKSIIDDLYKILPSADVPVIIWLDE
jgi:DNA polymerase III subunit beta